MADLWCQPGGRCRLPHHGLWRNCRRRAGRWWRGPGCHAVIRWEPPNC